jgi:hypothetical protein
MLDELDRDRSRQGILIGLTDEGAARLSLEQQVRTALSRVIDPEIRKPITELDMVGDVRSTPVARIRHHQADDRRMPGGRHVSNAMWSDAVATVGVSSPTSTSPS